MITRNRAIEELLETCAAKNFCVYDSEAKRGEFTLRLLNLINISLSGILTAIIVSSDTRIDNSILLENRDLAVFKVDEVTYSRCLRHYKITLQGTLASNDDCIGIALNDKFDCVLFSF